MMTQTFTGHVFDPLDMKPIDVRLEDIVHGLSLTCRYNGQCREFYSVAQHSIHVANVLKMWGEPIAVQLAGMMHDAAEAYLGDVITPIKGNSQIDGYPFDAIESHVMDCIDHALNLPGHLIHAQRVRVADRRMLVTEMRVLFSHRGYDFGLEPIAGINIESIDPLLVERFFLRRFFQMHEEWLDS